MRDRVKTAAHFSAISSNSRNWGVIMTKRPLSVIGVIVAIACAAYVSDARAQVGFYFGPEGGWTGLQGTKTSVTGTNPVTGQSVTFPRSINPLIPAGMSAPAVVTSGDRGDSRESTVIAKMAAT